MNSYTDIAADGWVASLPRPLRPYALLARLDRPIGAWLLFLPGLWSILLAQAPWAETAWLVALFFTGSFLMRGAGCVVNDMWDRDLDRQVTRTAGRPLASGVLRMRHATIFLAVLLGISLLILLQLRPLAQALGVGSLVLVALYPLAKRVTWWPQLMLGITFGWGAPMGYAAAGGRIDAAALTLYAAAIVWILGYDTIYAHQDREDDALVGIKSTARLFAGQSKPFLIACYSATTLLLMTAVWLAGLRLAIIGVVLGALVFLGRQVRALDIDEPGLCLRLFKSNREFGLFVAAVIVIARL
jgi:4-hydroxybenzoate polyprenyltransferase